MIKTKEFSGIVNHDSLNTETKLNEFIERNKIKAMNIIDIKYSCTISGGQIMTTALLIYNEG